MGIVILDEPTNYLDRDGLGALVQGLEAYKGGVVIISHNEEFTDSVCTQKWIMEKSEIKVEGEIEEQQGPDEVYDDMGNKIDVKKAKPMEAKDIKKAIKDVEKKLKDHKKKNNLSEEDVWELQDKLAELTSALEGQSKK